MNIRFIHPKLFDSSEIGYLSFPERYLFFGLFCLADSEGRLPYDTRKIKKTVFGYDDEIETAQIVEYLGDMEAFGLILIYSVDDKDYIQLKTFSRYQFPVGEAPSKYPAPEGYEPPLCENEIEKIVADVTKRQNKKKTDTKKKELEKNTIIEFPLRSGKMYPLTKSEYAMLCDVYQFVDVMASLKEVKEYFAQYPERQCTKGTLMGFVQRYLFKKQSEDKRDSKVKQLESWLDE